MNASILVVDDESVIQETIGCALREDGYQVDTADSGEEALRRLAHQGFDVILSDLKMPGLTGLDVLEQSRALNPRVSVILMTGYATLETAIEALRRGADDYLLKPFELDALRLAVQRVLRQGQGVERGRQEPRELPPCTVRQAPVGESPTIAPRSAHGLREALRQFERQYVRDVLAQAGFDKREAARILEISLASLYRKLGDETAPPAPD